MNTVSKILIISVITSVLYILIFLTTYVFSAYFFTLNKVIDLPIFRNFQQNFYEKLGYRSIWQTKKDCVDFDADLIYVPKINFECKFNNVEFQTTLNFNNEGRKSEFREKLKSFSSKGIAVVGDSVAMGYGVNDNEVFSAVLEKKIKRPVYNLAVSSYATARELKRLEKSNLISKVDTVIIFYADNDLDENIAHNNKQKSENNKLIFDKIINERVGNLKQIRKMIRYSLQIPLQELRQKKIYFQWQDHERELMNVIKDFPFIHQKNIYIVITPGALWRKNYYKDYNPQKYKNYKNLDFIYIQKEKHHYFLIDGHPNKIGHEKIAEVLYNKLKASK
jgi:lysophospholipase L1-like esterase